METIKEKIIVIIGIVLVIALCCGAYYMLVYQSSDYYTQIDNTKVEKISKHNMNYEYTLISYNKNGKSKECKENVKKHRIKSYAILNKEHTKIPRPAEIRIKAMEFILCLNINL